MRLTTAWFLVFSIFAVVVGATLAPAENVLGGLLVIAGGVSIGLALRMLKDEQRAAQRHRRAGDRTTGTS
ncbi:hypothetical protein [Frigoribacterium salinisoli]